MTEAAPQVSVILPTHNRRHMLERSLQSVLRQTFPDFELIVVDDASTDETHSFIAGISDRRIRYLRMEHQVGAARARNAGIRQARAGLLAFQDSDDEWLPDKLDRQVTFIRSAPADVGLVVGAFILIEPTLRRTVRSEALERGADYGLDIVKGVPLVTPLWLVRRNAIEAAGLFDESLESSEDYELAFRLSRVCRFGAVPDIVLHKTGHAESLSGNERLLLRGLQIVYHRYPEFWRPYPDEEARLFRMIATLQLRAESRAAAVWTLLRSWWKRPSHLSPLRRAASVVLGPNALRSYLLTLRKRLRQNLGKEIP